MKPKKIGNCQQYQHNAFGSIFLCDTHPKVNGYSYDKTTTKNSATTKSQQSPTNLQQPLSGIQNLYLFQRVLRVPSDYSSTQEKLTAT
jgi:hypothetical protein